MQRTSLVSSLLVTTAAAALFSSPAAAQNTFVQEYTTTLSSAGEAPDNMTGAFSPGTGTGTFDLFFNPTTSVYSLDYNVTAQNLVYAENPALPDPIMMAHIHDHYMYATQPDGTTTVSPFLANGPVVKGVFDASVSGKMPLNGMTPYTFSGVWSSADAEMPFTPQMLTDLKAGDLYFNVHTNNYPNGAIRGEIVPSGLAAAPEPSQAAVLGLGVLGVAALTIRTRRRAAHIV